MTVTDTTATACELPMEPVHTLAELVIDRLGRMPKVGDQVRVNGVRLRVLAVKGLRIALLEVTFPRPPGHPTANRAA
jgi:putative hemolysin